MSDAADSHKETQRIEASFCTAEIPELFMLLAVIFINE
jgi:hypothetical protein